MKRGEVWTAAGRSAYAGKPRPVLIIQDDRFDATDWITVCPFTSDSTFALFRVPIEPSSNNGLRHRSSGQWRCFSPLPDDDEVNPIRRALLIP